MSKKMNFEEWAEMEPIVFTTYVHYARRSWNFCASQYDSENASLKSELEQLKKENQELAAQHCSSAVLDEHGNRRCSQTGELI